MGVAARGYKIEDFKDISYLFVTNDSDCGWIMVRTMLKEEDNRDGEIKYLPQYPRHVVLRRPNYGISLPFPVNLEKLKIGPQEALAIAKKRYDNLEKLGMEYIQLSLDYGQKGKEPYF